MVIPKRSQKKPILALELRINKMTGKSLLTFFQKYYSVLILFVSILIYRINVLVSFGFKYTDPDQTIMWLGATDYAKGEFHEPFFYGQDYNVMLESFLAVPFQWMNLPLNIALPIITTLLVLLPFFILAILSLRNNQILSAIFILSIPLCLPIEYDLHTSISRGFVTGIALFSLSFLFYRNMEVSNNQKHGFILFLAILAFIVNPNSILLSLPVLLYFFLLNYKSFHYYKQSLIGLFAGLLIYFLIQLFYRTNPNVAIHGYILDFSFEKFQKGIQDIDSFFRMVTPIFWKQGFLSVLYPILFSIYFFRIKKTELAVVSLFLPLFYLLPLPLNKVHDGTDSVFFHLSRMYLAVPIVLALLLFSIKFGKSKLQHFVFIIPLGFLFLKSVNLEKSIESNMNKNHIIAVTQTNKLFKECKSLMNFSEENKIELIIFSTYNKNELFNYGCSACEPEFPRTLYPFYERRTWRLIEDENKVYNRILVFDSTRNLSKEYKNVRKVNLFKDMYLINNNEESTLKLINRLKIPVRKY